MSKIDGHQKITRAALDHIYNSCGYIENICRPGMFDKAFFRPWLKGEDTSNPHDNYKAFIGWTLGHIPIYSAHYNSHLVNRVASVDLDAATLCNHYRQEGQRFHFMKAPNESEFKAHENGVQFIYDNTLNWVQAHVQLLKTAGSSCLDRHHLREESVKGLAYALHALQDSFSTGHVVRARSRDQTKIDDLDIHTGRSTKIGSVFANQALPICRIHEYTSEKHDHDAHGKFDYHSGSLNQIEGMWAVNASIDLIQLGLDSIAREMNVLIGWERFMVWWLDQHQLPHINKPVGQHPRSLLHKACRITR